MMSVFERVVNLRSFRTARDELIPRKKIGKILEAGRMAPSPGNVQSLEFVVVEDHEKKELLETATGDKRVHNTPTAVIVIADMNRMARRIGEDNAVEACSGESAAAVQNMRLVAEDEGIASCWISGFDRTAVSNGFRIPNGKEPMGIMLLSYSEDKYPEEDRFGMNSVVFYNEYDNQIDSMFDSLEWEGLRENKEVLERKSKKMRSKIRNAFEDIL